MNSAMTLSGKQISQIHQALLDAFSSDALRMMVRIELNENPESIAAGGNQSARIFNLIEWAERHGRVKDLIVGAFNQNDGNFVLSRLAQDSKSWFDTVVSPQTSSGSTTTIVSLPNTQFSSQTEQEYAQPDTQSEAAMETWVVAAEMNPTKRVSKEALGITLETSPTDSNSIRPKIDEPLSSGTFDINILETGDGQCTVTAHHDKTGETSSLVIWPWSELELENRLKDLQIALLRSGSKRRQVLSREQETVKQFGEELFNLLFNREILAHFRISKQVTTGGSLRIRLRSRVPHFDALPWEFLYDPTAREFLSLSNQTPVIRTLDTAQSIEPLAVNPPLRILGMIASPQDLPALDVEKERQRIERALQPLLSTGLVEWVWLEGQTWRDLQRAMRRGPWHIFHFIGHGGFDPVSDTGVLCLADDDNRCRRLTAVDLGRLLTDHTHLRLVLLNACESARPGNLDVFSSTAATLIHRGLPAVVAMQYEITDTAAIEFARTFYESIADNLPVDLAVSEARKAITLEIPNTVEWGTPVLYMRSPDGVLFKVGTRPRNSVVLPRPDAPSDHTIHTSMNLNPTTVPPVQRSGEPISVSVEGLTHIPPKTAPAIRVRPTIEFEWIVVQDGPFRMGSNLDEDTNASIDEMPQHWVKLPAFRIARVPVTNSQYQRFIEETGVAAPSHWSNGSPSNDMTNHPVVNVSWRDALAFCRWAGVRLPSEAEWEKAARSDDGRLFPWGNTSPDMQRCNYGRTVGKTTSVDSYPQGSSAYGVLDMAGNVLEWTASLWGRELAIPQFGYPYMADDGREDLSAPDKVLRVLRGGAFNLGPASVRCAFRSSGNARRGRKSIGFRVAVSIEE